MRYSAALLAALLGSHAALAPLGAQSTPTCTGLACQQVSCPNSGTTTISGTVYAPNGTDPLPNVLVYIPNAAVAAFTPGVSCPAIGTPPSGSPLVGATTAVDGTFTLSNVPVGTNIPLVIVSGRWRRQITIPTTTACTNTPADPTMTRFPRNQSEGDIPKFAIATGSADSVECVLRKVGIADTEFTDPSGTGRINIYAGSGAPGATIDAATPSETALMSSSSTLNSYDVLMLPCEGGAYPAAKTSTEYANLIGYANAGGRVYSSHYAYQWMYQNPPFDGVANWDVNAGTYPDGLATVNPNFSASQTLSQWLTIVGAATTPGQIAISTIKHDMNGVIAPSESWLNLNSTGTVMQMVFDTPVGATGQQCGRVLYNEYHVETPVGTKTFPGECASGTTLNPQEKLLEFSLFELTNDGSAATLAPLTQDFGTEAIGFNSPAQTFIVTNNSSFAITTNLISATGDFTVSGNNCATIQGYGTCTITVVFNPTAQGARTGTLSVGSGGTTLTAALTGTGIPDFTLSPTSLTYGTADVGYTTGAQAVTVSNSPYGAVPVPGFLTSGDFAISKTTCGSSLAPSAQCLVYVTFTPTSTSDPRTGTLTVNSTNAGFANTSVALTGTGIDFTLTLDKSSGTTIAGVNAPVFHILTAPLSGFAAPLQLSCTVTAPGSTCIVANTSIPGSSAQTTGVAITTTAQYAVIGYTGGYTGPLSLLALASGLLLWFTRRRASHALRVTLTLVILAAATLTTSGCSGKIPAQNANYTVPGTYSYTLTATDGFLVHSATYSLTVTKN